MPYEFDKLVWLASKYEREHNSFQSFGYDSEE
jgi:hypothetical protein